MESYHILISFINGLFIRGDFASILSIIIAGKLLKTDTRNAFEIIRWIVIVYALFNICEVFVGWYSGTEMLSYFGRATGQYWFAFYLQMIPNTVLPLLLFFKKLGRNQYVLLALSFLMNISWWLEVYTIYATSDAHSKYVEGMHNYLWIMLLKDILIGSIIYAVGNAITAFQQRGFNARQE